MKKILFLFVLLLVLTGCAKPLQQEDEKEITYLIYDDEDFSVKYPSWPETDSADDVEVAVTQGYCSVFINTFESEAGPMYDYILDSIDDANLVESDKDKMFIVTNTDYLDYHFILETKIVSCNDKAHMILISCLEDRYKENPEIYDEIYNSIQCKEIPEELVYKSLKDGDFMIEYPEGTDISSADEENVLGTLYGGCSLFVNKYNALPYHLFEYTVDYLEGQKDYELVSTDSSDYVIKYTLPFGEQRLIATSEYLYCNYMTYSITAVCSDDFVTDETEKIKEKFLDSADCQKTYEIPEPETVEDIIDKFPEEEKDEVEEELEEIEELVVDTDVGEEFGIDESVLIYIINSNEFFTNILSDFDRINLIFEDDEEIIELKVEFDDNGKVIYVGDGKFSPADVTVYVPLRDALNIMNNAENLDPLNLLSFFINVRTDPANVKGDIIQNVLDGKYD